MYTEAARKYIPGAENWSDAQVDEVASSWSPLSRPGYQAMFPELLHSWLVKMVDG
jgi:hypothetical protein